MDTNNVLKQLGLKDKPDLKPDLEVDPELWSQTIESDMYRKKMQNILLAAQQGTLDKEAARTKIEELNTEALALYEAALQQKQR